MRIETNFLFDLDGTLIDSVYQHVLAWKRALDAEGIELSVWRIHRKIGMSGGLFSHQLLRETQLPIDAALIERLRERHALAFQEQAASIRPLPGARELLAALSRAGVGWAIATSGRMETAAAGLATLGVDPASAPVVTRDQVKYAKPDPDLFLAANARLGGAIENAISQHSADSAIASQWIANDTAGFFRRMCQCAKCGRIFIEDEKYRVFEFVPVDKDIPSNLLARETQ